MSETILVVNAGSSSIKFQLFAVEASGRLERRLKGQIEGIGIKPHLTAKDANGVILIDKFWSTEDVTELPDALDELVLFLRHHVGRLPVAIRHRVVHGGPIFAAPTVATLGVVQQLERFIPLAPLHQPNNLEPIRIVLERQPQMLQVACFDTAFHRGHPKVADRYAIPEALYTDGVRRYGFHGLSYECARWRRKLRALALS